MSDGRLRVAAVGYLNARPLYEGLDREPASSRIRLDCAVPSEVARRVAEDEADLALMPVAAAATIGDLRLVRGCAIGARGPVRSVVLVGGSARRGARGDRGRPVVAHERGARATAAARSTQGERAAGSSGLGPREAVAHVGQGARGAGHRRSGARDRGALPARARPGDGWRELTGLPFVFAAWCGRPGALSQDDERLLERAKLAGLDAATPSPRARGSHGPAGRLAPRLPRRGHPLRARRRRAPRPGALLRRRSASGPPPAPRASASSTTTRQLTAAAVPVSLDTLLSRAAEGERLSAAEGERLGRRGLALRPRPRRRRRPQAQAPRGVVTYIVDRNVNYTNVCTTSCRFCAFYRPPGHPEAYVLSREELGKKLQEVVDAGGVQILLQGGLHPELRIEWYEDLFRWMKRDVRARPARAVAGGDPAHRAARGAHDARRARAPACGGARQRPRRRGRDPRRPRPPHHRQGQVHERRVARRDARGPPHGPALQRHHDVRHRRHRRATASTTW